jgi:alpha-L-arabinofuranosidase
MIRHVVSVGSVAVLLAGCAPARDGTAREASAGGPATSTVASAGEVQQNLLRNASFDEGSGSDVSGWDQRNGDYGAPSLVTSPASSAPRALRVVVRKNASGETALMLSQVLDAAPYRGKRLRFGANVRTRGAGVILTLYTPERATNVLHDNPSTGEWTERSGTLDVPRNASFLSFGVQFPGVAGGEVWLDDVYVVPADAGAGAATRPGAPRAGAPSTGDPVNAATVTVDAARVSHDANPLIFGMHLEWVENGQGLYDAGRGELRADAVSALQALRIPLYRFPGGIHADYYDWRQGTGPANGRGRGFNPFTKQRELMRFGTPEFVQLLKTTGAQAMITANYGTGTAGMAAGWARAFQTLGVTPRYWEVGNEIYLASKKDDAPNGRAIYKTPEQYAQDFPRFRDSIKAVIPGASVGAIVDIQSGAYSWAAADNPDWSDKMLRALTVAPDFVAVHNSYAPVILDDKWDLGKANERDEVYRAMYASVDQVRENLDAVANAVAASPGMRGRAASTVKIAVTEFGPLFGLSTKSATHNAYVDHTRTMASALYVASLLDLYLSDPRVFSAAYTNPIHQWYGSLLTNTGGRLVRTPTYYLYELYRTRFEPRIVEATVSAPRFVTRTVGYARGRPQAPELLARASVSANGRRLTAMLVNRSTARTIATQLAVRGFTPTSAECQVLSASSANAINGPAITGTVATGAEIIPRPFPCTAGTSMELSIPPNAVVSVVATR